MVKPAPRIRKQKARARSGAGNGVRKATDGGSGDTNAAVLVPASKAERDERREKLREELRAQKPESRSSAQKRKRLEKYIDTKLKHDENREFIKKLEEETKRGNEIDGSLLRSSKRLGRGGENRREKMGRIMREHKAGIGNEKEGNIIMERRRDVEDDSSSDSEEEEADVGNHPSGQEKPNVSRPSYAEPTLSTFGAGLKRPLETDEGGNPVIPTRKRLKPTRSLPPPLSDANAIQITQDDNSEWNGIESSSEGEEKEANGILAVDTDTEEDEDSSEDDPSSRESGDADEYSSESDSESSENESIPGAESAAKAERVERSSAFKAWANQERNQVLGFRPTTTSDVVSAAENLSLSQKRTDGVETKVEETAEVDDGAKSKIDDIVSETQTARSQTIPKRQIFNVPVTRSDEIQEARSKLPVVAEEQNIMEAIHNNDCTIIWGATGSGKTTQIPQFLYEAGYGNSASSTPGMIGVTQPRRVAAVSMAKRVATELNDTEGKVSHQIRFDSSVGSQTAIKFMTDGVLLREVAQDFTLSKYSAIVIDEAHERSVNTDILIGMLSRIVETRADLSKKTPKYKPLKLVIMSATLRISDFTKNKSLFRRNEPLLVQAEGRQHPVIIHFARKTQRDYVEEAFHKVSRGHKKLPAGGMLVFLTGQNEIMQLAKRLKEAFPSTQDGALKHPEMRVSAATEQIEDEDLDFGKRDADEDSAFDSESDSEIRGADNDVDNEFDIVDGDPTEILKVHVLPLYSQLPTDQQMRVFDPTPDNSRMIVLATNVAETSLTIPNIRYVFDCGRAKEKQFSSNTGVQSFDVGWISKASASQRAGRAGRTGPGHCYRLYSSAVYERDFVEFSAPEIHRSSIEGVVLQLKSMGIPDVSSFPFPTPPDKRALLNAEQLLNQLGAISPTGAVTTIGQKLALYPLSPRLARMIVFAEGQAADCIPYAIALVAVLAVPEVFIPSNFSSDESLRKDYAAFHAHCSRLDRHSDAIKLLTTLCDYSSSPSLHAFGAFTRTKSLSEALALRGQLTKLVSHHSTISPGSGMGPLPPPTKKQIPSLRLIAAAGYIDRLAQRADLSPSPPASLRKNPRNARDVGYLTLFPSSADADAESQVYVHPSSVLPHTTSAAHMPQWLVYSHLSTGTPSTSARATSKPKTRLHPLTPLTTPQILTLTTGTPLLEQGKPVGRVEPLSKSDEGRERQACWVVPFLVPGSGGVSDTASATAVGGFQGWPLPPARKVVQRREKGGRGWVVESVLDSGSGGGGGGS